MSDDKSIPPMEAVYVTAMTQMLDCLMRYTHGLQALLLNASAGGTLAAMTAVPPYAGEQPPAPPDGGPTIPQDFVDDFDPRSSVGMLGSPPHGFVQEDVDDGQPEGHPAP